MKILVTGATGFIGSRIVESLLALNEGHEVRFSGRKSPRNDSLTKLGAQFVAGDLMKPEDVLKLAADLDVIIHCAGMAGTWGSDKEYERANVTATAHLLEAAKQNPVLRFIHISSPSIYFDYKDQLNLIENFVPNQFANAYARTKYEAELLVHSYHSSHFQTVSLRPRAVIGRGDKNILPRLIRLQKDGLLTQVGDGKNMVDITTIGNLTDAIILCLKAPFSAMGQSYNITNGEPMLFWDFVEQVLKAARLPSTRRKVPYKMMMLLARANELFRKAIMQKEEPTLLPISVGTMSFSMTLDITKAQARLGYKPRFSTQDGIQEFFGVR